MFGLPTVEVLQFIAILLMVIGTLCVIFTPRLVDRDGMRRAIQFLSVILVVPTILILALGKVLQPETVGTLIGALIGYLLSGIGSETPRGKSDSAANSKVAAQPGAPGDAQTAARP